MYLSLKVLDHLILKVHMEEHFCHKWLVVMLWLGLRLPPLRLQVLQQLEQERPERQHSKRHLMQLKLRQQLHRSVPK